MWGWQGEGELGGNEGVRRTLGPSGEGQNDLR